MAERLPDRRCDILVRCYGLDGDPKSTLRALGEKYGISGERVRQLRKKALRRMKHPVCKRELERLALATAQGFVQDALEHIEG
jgi:RNA polymerase primary sigma factor